MDRSSRKIFITCAAGLVALGALAVAPAPATATDAPDSTAVTGTASHVRAAAHPPVRASGGDVKTTRVANQRQLRRAVAKGNKRRGPDWIVLTADITLGKGKGKGARGGDLDITDTTNILGHGRTLTSEYRDRAFDVRDALVFFEDISLIRNAAPAGQGGGAVRAKDSTLYLQDVYVGYNRASGAGASGGAVLMNGGVLYMDDSTMVGNTATAAGGAIAGRGAEVTVRTSAIRDGRAAVGGGLHLDGDGVARIRQSEVFNNSADLDGGGVWSSGDGYLSLVGSTVADNTADGAEVGNGGGGLYNDGGEVYVVTSDIGVNKATGAGGSGGGVLNNAGDLTIENSKLIENVASRAGGAIEAELGTTTLVDTVLRGNAATAAPGNGGGLHLTGDGRVLLTGGRVVDNTAAAEGGGLWSSSTGSLEVARVTISGNTAGGADADQGGGGIYTDGGALTVVGALLTGNAATGASGSGGGVLNNGGFADIQTTTFFRNTASRAGGAVEGVAGTTWVTRSSLEQNATGSAPGNGGAVHLTGEGTVRATDSTFEFNDAVAQGGALWCSNTGRVFANGVTFEGNAAAEGADVYHQDPGATPTTSTCSINGTDVAQGSGLPVAP